MTPFEPGVYWTVEFNIFVQLKNIYTTLRIFCTQFSADWVLCIIALQIGKKSFQLINKTMQLKSSSSSTQSIAYYRFHHSKIILPFSKMPLVNLWLMLAVHLNRRSFLLIRWLFCPLNVVLSHNMLLLSLRWESLFVILHFTV